MKYVIVVSGMVSAVPLQGGATWAVAQYLLGFKRLGHEVYFVEPVAGEAVRPSGAALQDSDNARYFRGVMADFGFESASALLRTDTRETVGLAYDRIRDLCAHADLLINLSGLLTDEFLLERIPVRVYLDLDPAFTQFWQFTQNVDVRLNGHTHYATVGLAVGQPECGVPTGGLNWIPTLPPVVLDQWPVGSWLGFDALTTVANWRGYGSIEYDGQHYGQKAHSLRKLIELPCRSSARCVLALAIHPEERADLEKLREYHWELVNPLDVAATPAAYRGFIRSSWAELGVAKSGYVVSRCGWVSDRSACYLASGRPVIAQDTGFSSCIPTGQGLLAFDTTEQGVAAIEAVRADYGRHARAARSMAETWFNSDIVLSRLLERLGTTA